MKLILASHGPVPMLADGFALAPTRVSAVAGPSVKSSEGNRPASGGPVIPFRRATTPRTAISVSTTKTLTAGAQNVSEIIEGTGYILGVQLEVVATVPSTNSATVAATADAPYNILDTVSFADSGGEEINLGGYDLFLINLYGGFMDYLDSASGDTNVYSALVTGSGATGGNFRFQLLAPIAINTRNYLGLLGNQDRAMKYTLRTDIAASATVYSTAPTALPNIVINRTYLNATVPAPQNSAGVPQRQVPPKFGVQHFVTRTVNANPPVGGSTINHFLPRIGNTIRLIILVLRSNSSRATAESNLPTRVQFQLGDTPIFQETVQARRRIMYQAFGFDAPAGVLVYFWNQDLISKAGDELGLDWLWTNGVVNAQFQITYPSGFGSTANSLTVIVDDLVVPDNIDVYAPDGL